MNYIHPNGMIAEDMALVGRFMISANYTTDRREIILTEQELLDFGFKPEEEQEEEYNSPEEALEAYNKYIWSCTGVEIGSYKKEEKEDWIDKALEEFYDKHQCIDLQFIDEFKEIIKKHLPK